MNKLHRGGTLRVLKKRQTVHSGIVSWLRYALVDYNRGGIPLTVMVTHLIALAEASRLPERCAPLAT